MTSNPLAVSAFTVVTRAPSAPFVSLLTTLPVTTAKLPTGMLLLSFTAVGTSSITCTTRLPVVVTPPASVTLSGMPLRSKPSFPTALCVWALFKV